MIDQSCTQRKDCLVDNNHLSSLEPLKSVINEINFLDSMNSTKQEPKGYNLCNFLDLLVSTLEDICGSLSIDIDAFLHLLQY